MNTKDKLKKIGSLKTILKKYCNLIISSKKITIKMINTFLQSSWNFHIMSQFTTNWIRIFIKNCKWIFRKED